MKIINNYLSYIAKVFPISYLLCNLFIVLNIKKFKDLFKFS